MWPDDEPQERRLAEGTIAGSDLSGPPQAADVGGVGAAAAAEDNQARQERRQPGVAGRQRVRVTAVEVGGLVELGVASLRGVVPDAENAVRPRPGRPRLTCDTLLERLLDMGWVGAVDHEILGAGRSVYLGDRRRQQGSVREP